MVARDRAGPIRDVRLHPVHRLMTLFALLTGSIHVYVGFAADETAFFVLDANSAGWWYSSRGTGAPALYAVEALYVGALIVVRFLSGAWI